jgi:hypothetical protein
MQRGWKSSGAVQLCLVYLPNDCVNISIPVSCAALSTQHCILLIRFGPCIVCCSSVQYKNGANRQLAPHQ